MTSTRRPLLEQITGRSLGSDSVATLVARTEGWAAGLQLAGMTLRLYEDSDEFITQFSGDDRLIADYLSRRGPAGPAGRSASVPAADLRPGQDVRGTGRSPDRRAQRPARARGAGAGVDVPRSAGHPTVSGFVSTISSGTCCASNCGRSGPAPKPACSMRPAAWHLGRGEVSAGVEYLLRAQNWDAALDVIMGRGSEVFEKGEMATVIRWICEVPESARNGRRDVSLLLGILKGVEGQAASAEDILGRVATDPATLRRESGPAPRSSLPPWSNGGPARRSPSTWPSVPSTSWTDVGDAQMPVIMNLTHRASLETMALLSGGRAHFQAGDYVPARDWLNRGLASPGATLPDMEGQRPRLTGAARGLVRQHRAGQLPCPKRPWRWPGRSASWPIPRAADAYLASALVALETGEPRRASLSLHEGSLQSRGQPTQPVVVARPPREGPPPRGGRPTGTGA